MIVRFLIDNDLSWRLARALRQAGHDVVHVADIGMDQERDAIIVALARTEKRVIVTRDGDFGPLVLAGGTRDPSVIHLRTRDGRPSAEAAHLLPLLPALEADLGTGAIVTVEDAAIRVLPLV